MPDNEFILNTLRCLTRDVLLHVTNINGGQNVQLRDAFKYLDQRDLTSLDAAFLSSAAPDIRQSWEMFQRLDTKLRKDLVNLVKIKFARCAQENIQPERIGEFAARAINFGAN